jgi:hypothetical protein
MAKSSHSKWTTRAEVSSYRIDAGLVRLKQDYAFLLLGDLGLEPLFKIDRHHLIYALVVAVKKLKVESHAGCLCACLVAIIIILSRDLTAYGAILECFP